LAKTKQLTSAGSCIFIFFHKPHEKHELLFGRWVI